MLKLEIESVENGYIIKTLSFERNEDTGVEGYICDGTEVIEANEFKKPDEEEIEIFKTKDPDKVALAYLLTKVGETFGPYYDKYKTDNLSITFDRLGSRAPEKDEQET